MKAPDCNTDVLFSIYAISRRHGKKLKVAFPIHSIYQSNFVYIEIDREPANGILGKMS